MYWGRPEKYEDVLNKMREVAGEKEDLRDELVYEEKLKVEDDKVSRDIREQSRRTFRDQPRL